MTTRVFSFRQLRVHSDCLPRLKLFSKIRSYHSYDHVSPSGPFTVTQTQILSAAISHIPQHGFTLTSLSLGAKDAGYIDATTNLFPSGALSLVQYHLYSRRIALAAHKCLSHNKNSQDITALTKALTWDRLMGNRDIIHRWPEVRALSEPENLFY